jgi:hypothetical protein
MDDPAVEPWYWDIVRVLLGDAALPRAAGPRRARADAACREDGRRETATVVEWDPPDRAGDRPALFVERRSHRRDVT